MEGRCSVTLTVSTMAWKKTDPGPLFPFGGVFLPALAGGRVTQLPNFPN